MTARERCSWCDRYATHELGTLDARCDLHHAVWFTGSWPQRLRRAAGLERAFGSRAV